MSTTHDSYTLLSSLSDLEVSLFSTPIARAANTVAFVEWVIPGRLVQAANKRSYVPDPPRSNRPVGMIVESVLLRAA